MRLIAAVAWYLEPLASLDRMTRSLTGLIDELVAIDGPWNGFPHDLPASPPAEAAIIQSTAAEHGIHANVWTPSMPWASQVEKRDFLMRVASERGDWILVIDGDEWIDTPVVTKIEIAGLGGDLEPLDGSNSFDTVRQILATTSLDVATVTFRNTTGSNQQPGQTRRLYRAPVTVETVHHGYRTSDGRWLHGPPDRVQLEPAVEVPLSMLHDPSTRSTERHAASTAYREHRRRHQTERWH